MSEERSFEVVDKRRVRAEGEERAAPAENTAAEPAVDEADEFVGEADAADMPDLMGEITVSGVVHWAIGLLASKAWISMGLVPDPITGKIGRDLPEAKRAIDVVSDLVKHLTPAANPQQQRELQTMLTDLRVNYVRQSGEG